ncbi:MAG: formylglycine-generating enzyme family protein [Litorimonas sp.]
MAIDSNIPLIVTMLFLVSVVACKDIGSGHSDEFKSASPDTCLSVTGLKAPIQAGTYQMGSERDYPEERPTRELTMGPFDIDVTEVTNAQFAEFVEQTAYVTSAEQIQPGFETSGAAVFTPPDVKNPSWWRFVEGANWRHPDGPESSIEGRGAEPVVQVSQADAKAYAEWAGRALPSEAQWEYAAKAGSYTRYVWGEARTIDGVEQANTWQGAFPIQNTQDDGYLQRSPVGCYPPNSFGLHDMIGNVWEWTDTIYKQGEGESVYVIKGGSFLCAENYCRRYRPAARQPQEAGFPTNHIGFRTVSLE